jgi:predicted Zn-dependent protease
MASEVFKSCHFPSCLALSSLLFYSNLITVSLYSHNFCKSHTESVPFTMGAERHEAVALLKSTYSRQKIEALPDLKQGDAQEEIKHVQNYLKHYGYLTAGDKCTEGTFDETTSNAITSFQKFFKIEETGSLDATTKTAMAGGRCGFPDILDPLAFNTTATGWNYRNLKYTFGNLSARVTADVARGAVRRAFDVWASTGLGLRFTEVASNQSPDIFVEWRRAADPDHSMVGGILAHADFPPGFSIITNTLPLPLHFDDEEHVWVDGAAPNGFDIQTVAIHEIGHTLGMYHTNVGGAVMFPSVTPNLTLRDLQPDDIAGITKLYPSVTPPASGWSNLSGKINAEVGVTSWAPGRVDIFVQGTDTAVYHKWKQDNSWGPSISGYEFMGGKIIGSPVPVSWGSNRIDLFVQGTDRAVYHKWWDGSSWGPSVTEYETLGGTIIGDPVAVAWGNNRLDIFVRGTNNAVYHKWWDGSKWGPSKTDWESLGGVILGGVSAVSWSANRLDLFVQGTDKAVHHKWWDGSNWGPSKDSWETLGGISVGDPVAVSWGPKRLDIFCQGTDKALYHKWWDGSNWNPSKTGWESLGGGLFGKPSAVGWGGNKLDVFVRDLDSAVYRKSWNGISWVPSATGYTRLGGVITNGPAPNPRGSAQPEVFARGTDNGLYMWS